MTDMAAALQYSEEEIIASILYSMDPISRSAKLVTFNDVPIDTIMDCTKALIRAKSNAC